MRCSPFSMIILASIVRDECITGCLRVCLTIDLSGRFKEKPIWMSWQKSDRNNSIENWAAAAAAVVVHIENIIMGLRTIDHHHPIFKLHLSSLNVFVRGTYRIFLMWSTTAAISVWLLSANSNRQENLSFLNDSVKGSGYLG